MSIGVEFKEKMIELVEASSMLFKNHKARGCKILKYFSYEFKKSSNLGKLYLLPEIHKRLTNVSGEPVISN